MLSMRVPVLTDLGSGSFIDHLCEIEGIKTRL
jgi:hypothetical protein